MGRLRVFSPRLQVLHRMKRWLDVWAGPWYGDRLLEILTRQAWRQAIEWLKLTLDFFHDALINSPEFGSLSCAQIEAANLYHCVPSLQLQAVSLPGYSLPHKTDQNRKVK